MRFPILDTYDYSLAFIPETIFLIISQLICDNYGLVPVTSHAVVSNPNRNFTTTSLCVHVCCIIV